MARFVVSGFKVKRGEGGLTISTSTGTLRSVSHGIRTLVDVSDINIDKRARNDAQYCHKNGEPQFLRTQ